MKTKAAILHEPGKDWEVEEIELGDPIEGEVQVRLAASGLCHSDEHLRTGATPMAIYPAVGGHEGAGVVTKVGPGVTGISEGDHVVLTFIPGCGRCRACAQGMQNLCDAGAGLLSGEAISGGYRINYQGKPVAPMCLLGTFAPYVTVNQASVQTIEKDIPLDKAALLGCGVSTGWGTATEIGGTRTGDTVVVMGCGGVGINAVQGAAAAGARYVVAVDPVEFKRSKAEELGATHTFATMEEAHAAVGELTWGQLADNVLICIGETTGEHLQPALSMTKKGGQVVVTGMGRADQIDAQVSLFELTLLQKRLQGAIFGGVSPRTQIPRLLEHYRNGTLKLDELVTTEYSLEDINTGYADMMAGKNLRGIIRYTEADY
ncbi:NDMA-dependent alcohol dehydrogenase [Saccharopolyspora mangrovi]|uniref:NDMA-dependent alcohol dehydrogenase n=1 Tax=Saccharopolyspora mangrovi TaxID=3082379 RepID=A0ABU6A6P6_9PSEU|nr:NDMA-dependent alcohol dehydrogenase [Saccharopolyspora sp. S2-29]MEB3367196.1 NDMA-dependent alcohol dehydrogenase [Saccharopolyspora sp. S2-29]